ncbi:hypothetical protein ACJMK2_025765 [Sinanodonta woodiana]|uniref:SH3b domain-containing protein n=1 Tax=Sinanodonta woodiana TaxID=1069815 RepID=A0ABD3XJ11_SINWO
MKFLVIFVVALATKAMANITGQHPATGACLCISGSAVNARENHSTQSAVVASLNNGDCFKFNGGILTAEGYTWYQLQNVNGHNAWVVGNYLNTADAAKCTTAATTGTASCGAAVKDLACKILALHTITLWAQHPSGVNDNAFSLNNIRDTCNGLKASRSHYTCAECRSPGAPGGQVCLSETLLRYIYDLGTHGQVHVNEIAGACHHCTSDHYSGRAVDLHNDARSSEYISKCKAVGGTPLDEGNHIHCSVHS